MKVVATAFLLLLMCSTRAAHAAPVTFEVGYATLFNQYCFYHSGICVPRPLNSFTRTVTLDSAQLMVDGIYDVAAALDPAPAVTPPPDGTATMLLQAFATVADKHVIDLSIEFVGVIEESCFGFPKRTTSMFVASSGTWGSTTSVSSISGDVCNGFSTEAMGTYTVQQLPTEVPEPGSLMLVLGGGLLARTRRRPSR